MSIEAVGQASAADLITATSSGQVCAVAGGPSRRRRRRSKVGAILMQVPALMQRSGWVRY